MPLLTDEHWRRLLAESITIATANHGYSLLALVFMPEHVHLLVLPQHHDPKISDLLSAIKRPYSFRIKMLLEKSNSQLLTELTIRQRKDVMTFRYWQEGPGYDRNLDSGQSIEGALNYIHLNPVRRKLCERAIDWKWSSARHYVLGASEVDADLPRIDPLPPELLD
jgi:putative transposase